MGTLCPAGEVFTSLYPLLLNHFNLRLIDNNSSLSLLRNRSITRKVSLIQNLQNLLRLISKNDIDRAVVGHTGHTFYVLVQVLVLTMSFSIQLHSILQFSSPLMKATPNKPRSRRRWLESSLSFCRFSLISRIAARLRSYIFVGDLPGSIVANKRDRKSVV